MRVLASVLAVLLIASGLVVGTGFSGALADANISLAVTADANVLAGEGAGVHMTATNENATTDYYNLSFRYELPQGVTYKGGSSKLPDSPKPDLPDPVVVTITDTVDINGDPLLTHQVLIWPNVSDLQHGDSVGLSFEVEPDPSVKPVGATFGGEGGAYANSDARYVPKFDGTTGVAQTGSNSYDASDEATPVVTKVSALKITKSEPSPESELMRGVHDQTTVYTITVTNTTIAATDDVMVVDYLPATLEFLGCGLVDNSAPGTEEYTGSGRLDGTPAVGSDCLTPVSVETVENPGSLSGVFTKVVWDLGTLGGSDPDVVTIKYAAAIPLRANTMTWPGTEPDAVSLEQAANLDNNTGAFTRQNGAGSSATNTVTATGTYTGPVVVDPADRAVEATAAKTVKMMDLSVVKSVTTPDAGDFNSDKDATFKLHLRVSEYTNARAMTITDTIPNGLCPLVPDTVTLSIAPGNDPSNLPSKCEPSGSGSVDNATVDSLTWNADGTFTLVMTPDPTQIDADGTLDVTYDAFMGASYLDSATGAPTVAGDSFVNSVEIAGTTDDLVSTLDAVGVNDDSGAGIHSAPPKISKKVLSRPIPVDGTPVDCATAIGYIDHTTDPAPLPPSYQVGDKICFELTVTFSESTLTRNAQITDFVPVGTSFDGFEVAGDSDVPADQVTPVAGTEAATPRGDKPASWNLGDKEGDNYYVGKGATLTMYVSAIAVSAAVSTDVDITANLMKYRQESTNGTVVALRDQADYGVYVVDPQLSKGVLSVARSGSPTKTYSPPAADAPVIEGDDVTYQIDVSEFGSFEMENIQVWDALPDGLSCVSAQVTDISDSGICYDPTDTGYPSDSVAVGGGLFIDDTTTLDGRSVIIWTIPVVGSVTYTLTIPDEVSVSTVYTN